MNGDTQVPRWAGVLVIIGVIALLCGGIAACNPDLLGATVAEVIK